MLISLDLVFFVFGFVWYSTHQNCISAMAVGMDDATAAVVTTDGADAWRSAAMTMMTSASVTNANAAADAGMSLNHCHYYGRPMTTTTTIWPIVGHYCDLAIVALSWDHRIWNSRLWCHCRHCHCQCRCCRYGPPATAHGAACVDAIDYSTFELIFGITVGYELANLSLANGLFPLLTLLYVAMSIDASGILFSPFFQYLFLDIVSCFLRNWLSYCVWF